MPTSPDYNKITRDKQMAATVLCRCQHYREAHVKSTGECSAPNCKCAKFVIWVRK